MTEMLLSGYPHSHCPQTPSAVPVTILSGYGSQLFQTHIPGCDTLYVDDVIDVDTFSGHMDINLTVKVSDGYGCSGVGFVSVHVDDINDHAPIISPMSLRLNICPR